MNQQLKLEISSEVYRDLQQKADAVGLSITDWVTDLLKEQTDIENEASKLAETSVEQTETSREEVWQRLKSYAGSIRNGGSADNDDIDADLAKAYANDF